MYQTTRGLNCDGEYFQELVVKSTKKLIGREFRDEHEF